MKVINLLASPGSGKSTGAAYIFAKLKLAGYNAELVTEYAKRKVYEKSESVLENQIYVLGKQYKTLKDLQKYGVEVAVSDSPLMLCAYYGRNAGYFKEFYPLLSRLNQEFENIDIFINRVKPYNPAGRLQTEAESDEIGMYLKESFGYDYSVNGNEAGYDLIVDGYKRRYPKS